MKRWRRTGWTGKWTANGRQRTQNTDTTTDTITDMDMARLTVHSLDSQMVDAGWCYDPSPEADDGVTCFYCNLSLDGWEPKDNPL